VNSLEGYFSHLKPGDDVDAPAHRFSVCFLDDVADINADAGVPSS